MSTSLQRTYRNLRLGIAGTVVLIGIAVAVVSVRVGVLGSISAYYYTPARNVIVGALIAAAVALLALSGRGVQRALLDAAALMAPLIALVPTPIAAGSVPGMSVECASGSRCHPDGVLPEIETGVTVYLVAGVLGVVVALVVAGRGSGSISPVGSSVGGGGGADAVAGPATGVRALLPSVGIALGVLLVVFLTFVFARDAFLSWGHLVSAVVFFGLIAVLAIVNVVERPDPLVAPPSAELARAYGVIAVALVVDLVVTVGAVAASAGQGPGAGGSAAGGVPVLFVGEAIALALFVVFWVLQSRQKWDQADPAVAGTT